MRTVYSRVAAPAKQTFAESRGSSAVFNTCSSFYAATARSRIAMLDLLGER